MDSYMLTMERFLLRMSSKEASILKLLRMEKSKQKTVQYKSKTSASKTYQNSKDSNYQYTTSHHLGEERRSRTYLRRRSQIYKRTTITYLNLRRSPLQLRFQLNRNQTQSKSLRNSTEKQLLSMISNMLLSALSSSTRRIS